MPTMRPRSPQPELSEFTLAEKMSFLSGWGPTRGRGRWQSWAEYLADFTRLRASLLAQFPRWDPTRPLFGDCALAYRQAHGAAALETATYDEIRGTLETKP